MRLHILSAVALLASTSVIFADEITETIDQARQSYESGDLAGAKQSLDLASQLVGQKKAEKFGALLPPALPGWTAAEVQANAIGNLGFGLVLGSGVSTASRTYTNSEHQEVEVSIVGDSTLLTQLTALLANPTLAGLSGNKVVRIGKETGFQDKAGDIILVVAKYVITVKGSGPTAAKLAYAQAIDVAKLTKM